MKSTVFGKKSGWMWIVIALWAAALVTVVVLTATKIVNSAPKRPPVYRVAREDRKIALTFNCAWGDETTDAVLSALRAQGTPATFFFVGEFAQKYPESVKKIANAGHEIGNHSMRHKDPTRQDYTAVSADMDACNDLLFSLTGIKPRVYRAPSGAWDTKTVEAAENLGMTAVQWSADSVDWKDPAPETILRRVEKRVSPGGIVLLHLGKENTAAALPALLENLKAAGYEFVTVSDLLLPGETYVDGEGVQRPAAQEKQNERPAAFEPRDAIIIRKSVYKLSRRISATSAWVSTL